MAIEGTQRVKSHHNNAEWFHHGRGGGEDGEVNVYKHATTVCVCGGERERERGDSTMSLWDRDECWESQWFNIHMNNKPQL